MLATLCPPAGRQTCALLLSFQKRCPQVVAVFHRVLACLRLACRMETAVGNSTCVLRMGVGDAAWHMSTEGRTTDHLSLASLGLSVSKVSEPALESDVTCRSACTRGNSLPIFVSFSFRVYCNCSRHPELAPLALLCFGPVELSMDVSGEPHTAASHGAGFYVCHIPTQRQQDITRRTLKFTFVMSSNPSSTVGSRYREAKPVNAILGNMVLDSGFICRCKSIMEFFRMQGTFDCVY